LANKAGRQKVAASSTVTAIVCAFMEREDMPAQIIKTDTVHSGWATLLVAAIRLPSGETIRREIEDHGAAACVLPYHPTRKTAILVRQLRPAVFFATRQDETIEAIAGIVDEADPAETARREAEEEAGLALGDLEHVVSGWTMPGLSTEQMHFYFATYDEGPRGAGGGKASEHEHITVVEIGLNELAAMADRGDLADVKTLLLVQTLRLRRPELFTDSKAR